MNLCICFQPVTGNTASVVQFSCQFEVPLEFHSATSCKVKGQHPGSDEAGVLQELNEHLIDKLILGDGLHHQHPLLPQLRQHGGNLHRLIVLQAADHELSEDDHSGATHPGAAVDHHRGVEAL